ncbi:MAG: tetratricopeptide repeat protein [Bacteroidota bacterium]
MSLLSKLCDTADEGDWQKYNEQLFKICNFKLNLKNLTIREKYIYKNYYAAALNNIGFLKEEKHYYDSALFYYNKSVEISKELKNKSGEAETYLNIGNLYINIDKLEEALEANKIALKLSKEINDIVIQSTVLNNLGNIYQRKGDVKNAINAFSESIKIRESNGLNDGISTMIGNLANIYGSEGDLDISLKYHIKSLNICRHRDDKRGIVTSLNNIGMLHLLQHDTLKGLRLFFEALNISTSANNKKGEALAKSKLSTYYKQKGKIDSALYYIESSLAIREKIHDNSGVAKALYKIGDLYLSLNKIRMAESYLTKSYSIANKIQNIDCLQSSSNGLYRLYKTKQDPAKALQFYELYIKLRDSVLSFENRSTSIKSQLKYEYEKKVAADSIKVAEEKKISDLKLTQEKTQKNYLYVSLVIITVFGLFMFNRFRVTKKQKNIIEFQKIEAEQQKALVDEKQKEILDSIRYAKRIQDSLMVKEKYIKEKINKHI